MELFKLRRPITDLSITSDGVGNIAIGLFVNGKYVADIHCPPDDAYKLIDMFTHTDPCGEIQEEGIVAWWGNYVGPLIGEDYKRYHTEELE